MDQPSYFAFAAFAQKPRKQVCRDFSGTWRRLAAEYYRQNSASQPPRVALHPPSENSGVLSVAWKSPFVMNYFVFSSTFVTRIHLRSVSYADSVDCINLYS